MTTLKITEKGLEPRTIGTAPDFFGSSTAPDYIWPKAYIPQPDLSSLDEVQGGVIAVPAKHPAEIKFTATINSGMYTVDWGDGTALEDVASGVEASHSYDYDALGDQNVQSLNSSTDSVDYTAHPYVTGDVVSFFNITTTTSLEEGRQYYVTAPLTNSFQIEKRKNSSVVSIDLTGTGNLSPFRQVVLQVTPKDSGSKFLEMDHPVRVGPNAVYHYVFSKSDGLLTFSFGYSSETQGLDYKAGHLQDVYMNNTAQLDYSFNFLSQYGLQTASRVFTPVGTDLTGMFAGCTGLRYFPESINLATVQELTRFLDDGYGEQAGHFTEIPTMSLPSCTSLESFMGTTRQISTVNLPYLPNCNSVQKAFRNMNLSSGYINSRNISDFRFAFVNNNLVKATDLKLNLSSLIHATSMFAENGIMISGYPTYHDTTTAPGNMIFGYDSCYSLAEMPYTRITADARAFKNMFEFCFSLEHVEIGKYVTPFYLDIQSAFSGCWGIRSASVDFRGYPGTFTKLFEQCRQLKAVDILLQSPGEGSNITFLFIDCHHLQSPVLKTINTTTEYNIDGLYHRCKSLMKIDRDEDFTTLPSLPIAPIAGNAPYTDDCYSLQRIQPLNYFKFLSTTNCKLSAAALDELYSIMPIESVYIYGADLVRNDLIRMRTGTLGVTISYPYRILEGVPSIPVDIGMLRASTTNNITLVNETPTKVEIEDIGKRNGATLALTGLETTISLGLLGIPFITIYVSGNYGTLGDTPSIATDKGYLVNGSDWI